MRKAVANGLRAAAWVLGVAAGFIGTAILVLGIAWFFTRDPSAESEVRKLMSTERVAHAVEVGDCRYSETDSVDSYYWCELRISKRVRMMDGNGEPRVLRPGTRRFCFDVPRAASGDSDYDALLLYPLDADGRC